MNGFGHEDGRLRLVAGSHKLREDRDLFEADRDRYASEAAWAEAYLKPRGLAPTELRAPPGTVAVVDTWTVHGVAPAVGRGPTHRRRLAQVSR